MKIKLRIEVREGAKGRKVVAPFINNWCVWSIPEKEWTASVAEAVARAYALGAQHMRNEIIETIEAPSVFEPVWESGE